MIKRTQLNSILVLVILLILWTGLYFSGLYSPLVLPSPLMVLQKIMYSFTNDDLLGQVFRSIIVIIKGLFIACAVVSGALFLSERYGQVGEGVNTLCALFHPLPGIAILPIFMIWFGVGESAIVAVIVHSVIWPLYLNLRSGIHSIPKVYEQVCRGFDIHGLTKWKHVYFPAVLPHILSGLRTGWARGWRALISAEMIFGAIGGGGGLGWFIFKNRVFMDTAGMFAGLIIVIGVGLIVEKGIFEVIESKTLRKWGMIE